MVKTSPSNAGGAGSIPGHDIKIPHVSQPKIQNIKQKQYCNKFNKDFKDGPHQKKLSNSHNGHHHTVFRVCSVEHWTGHLSSVECGAGLWSSHAFPGWSTALISYITDEERESWMLNASPKVTHLELGVS